MLFRPLQILLVNPGIYTSGDAMMPLLSFQILLKNTHSVTHSQCDTNTHQLWPSCTYSVTVTVTVTVIVTATVTQANSI